MSDLFIYGVQVDAWEFDPAAPTQILDRLSPLKDLNTLVVFGVPESKIPYPDPSVSEGQFTKLVPAAAERGIEIYLGGGEEPWVLGDHPAYKDVRMLDPEAAPLPYSCMNHPGWREFQVTKHRNMFLQNPVLAGLMFMHERVGPLCSLMIPGEWQGEQRPWCFCEHCREKARYEGIDPERARSGYRQLTRLITNTSNANRSSGVFISFWRLLLQYPEILAWDQLFWNSLHAYRAEVSSAVREASTKAKIGVHFQHRTLTTDFLWRAGDRPEVVKTYADWVKPSIYPGASGSRYRNSFHGLNQTLFQDLSADTLRDFLAGIMGHDLTDATRALQSEEQSAFGGGWIQQEIRRTAAEAAPLPLLAGYGFGIPGGEEADSPETIKQGIHACFEAGIQGMLLSRHLSEMPPEFLQAAGEAMSEHL